ncbi:MAG: serine acetyltransferase [Bacteroidetes bacterium]|nr:serine acetyltransferase [Bacteroidota bacterium]
MIRNRTDLKYYLKMDRIALKRKKRSLNYILKEFFIPDYIYQFQKALRKTEYYFNMRSNPFYSFLFILSYFRYKRLSVKCGFSIPLNVFGPGLAIVHLGTIVVNPLAKVGSNCRIHVCTNIGASGGLAAAPQIGDNVYIAPGVKIYGGITVADNIAFAANAAVNDNCLESNMLYGGVPAKKICPINIKNLLKHIVDE